MQSFRDTFWILTYSEFKKRAPHFHHQESFPGDKDHGSLWSLIVLLAQMTWQLRVSVHTETSLIFFCNLWWKRNKQLFLDNLEFLWTSLLKNHTQQPACDLTSTNSERWEEDDIPYILILQRIQTPFVKLKLIGNSVILILVFCQTTTKNSELHKCQIKKWNAHYISNHLEKV